MEKLPEKICEWYWKGECVLSSMGCNGYPDWACDKYAPRGPLCRFCALRSECENNEEWRKTMGPVEETGDCKMYLDPYDTRPDEYEEDV